MLSKVQFDLSENNSPIIKATIQSSPDVRDTIAKKFIEAFAHQSTTCNVTFYQFDEKSPVIVYIEPVRPSEFKKEER